MSQLPNHFCSTELCAFITPHCTDACSQSEYSYLASGSRDKTVKLWDPLKNACLATFTCHDNWVRSVLLHPNGKYIISCSDDKSIRVVDIKVR